MAVGVQQLLGSFNSRTALQIINYCASLCGTLYQRIEEHFFPEIAITIGRSWEFWGSSGH
jgi:hypothetical protein